MKLLVLAINGNPYILGMPFVATKFASRWHHIFILDISFQVEPVLKGMAPDWRLYRLQGGKEMVWVQCGIFIEE